jgi:hypothetical protein
MVTTNLIFYPQHYIGFNKVALLERQLQAAGFLARRLTKSSCYFPGRYFHHYAPRQAKSQGDAGCTNRIYLQAVGLWLSPDMRSRFMERTNLVIVEGDVIDCTDSYKYLINLLMRITGDTYCCQLLPGYSVAAIEDSQRARFA